MPSDQFTQSGPFAGPVTFDSLFRSQLFTPLMWGAVGNGASDDTLAVQRAIDALPAGGGIIYFPAAFTFACATGLAISKPNVTFLGASNKNESLINVSTLIFTGTGSTRFIDARDSRGFRVENMRVQYSSSSF